MGVMNVYGFPFHLIMGCFVEFDDYDNVFHSEFWMDRSFVVIVIN